ncbi:Nucleoside diphosphate kinase [Nosema granulosis]|uniref:Nucleoside diphosphate kinase n=1 Tax=Nosema granulosis TaxID=83296 RepID=A0A9P6GXN8_9MICR|nr:Nucleoside diphosphate kinase [Nosema granulosis]
MIKPDATKRNLIGKINSYLENAGLKIVAQKMVRLEESQAREFYAEHKERSFFSGLITYMTSAPVVLQVLKGENAITKSREIMGATNPAEARPGTVRKDFAVDIEANSIHGSDSIESAEREINFFFSKEEIVE